MKTNAAGQQGQYGNGDGYHTGGGGASDVTNGQVYGSRSGGAYGPSLVAGTPFPVSVADPSPPIVHLAPQYVTPTAAPAVPAPFFGPQAAAYAPPVQAPVRFDYGIPQLPPVLQQQPLGTVLPPYNVQLPALTLTARSPSGQYVVPMPPKLYVDKPDGASDG